MTVGKKGRRKTTKRNRSLKRQSYQSIRRRQTLCKKYPKPLQMSFIPCDDTVGEKKERRWNGFVKGHNRGKKPHHSKHKKVKHPPQPNSRSHPKSRVCIPKHVSLQIQASKIKWKATSSSTSDHICLHCHKDFSTKGSLERHNRYIQYTDTESTNKHNQQQDPSILVTVDDTALANERHDSSSSSSTLNHSSQDDSECYFCFELCTTKSPCKCQALIHTQCLQEYRCFKQQDACTICLQSFSCTISEPSVSAEKANPSLVFDVNSRVKVYWDAEQEWYSGFCKAKVAGKSNYWTIEYDDGDQMDSHVSELFDDEFR